MANGLPWVGSGGRAPNPRDQYAPAPGSYAPPGATEATNTSEDMPPSRSPGPAGHTNQVTSRQGSSREPKQGTSSAIYPSLRKPDLMR